MVLKHTTLLVIVILCCCSCVCSRLLDVNRTISSTKTKDTDESTVKTPPCCGTGPSIVRVREIRDVGKFEDNEIGWTNINEEVDITIPLVLSHLEFSTTFYKLPDMKETLTVQPLFITYSAGLLLYNGTTHNIEGINRYGDAMMTYNNKAFHFRLNLIISKLQFDYDFEIGLIGMSTTGSVVGTLKDLLISGDFSIDVQDPVIKLNDLQILKFGNLFVQLKYSQIIQQISGFILTPITNLFRDRIKTGITTDMKIQIAALVKDFSEKDELGIRDFMQDILSGITGHKKRT